jgi:hemerythrin-like metal-binding protein
LAIAALAIDPVRQNEEPMKLRPLFILFAILLSADLAFLLAWSLWLGSHGSFSFSLVLWIGLLTAVLLVWIQAAMVFRTLNRLADSRGILEEYSKGNMTGRLEVATQGNEVDEMFLAVNKLGTSITAIVGEIHGANRTLESVSGDFRERFEQIYGASESMKDRSGAVAKAAEEASSGLLSISTAAEQMSSSVMTVAAAMDSMRDATNEVAGNCLKESRIATAAEKKAGASREFMERLGQSAQEIGRIISLISDIAERTNLLALNATIEAARAGAAGRGFTVVASEVKELALQTTKATAEIREQIEQMQNNAGSAVTSMVEISKTIEEVNMISQSIAAAMEEQTATSQGIAQNIASASDAANDIARNVSMSAQGIPEVSTHIQEVSEQTATVAGGIKESRDRTRNLVDLVHNLGGVIASFKTGSTRRSITADLLTGVDGMDKQHRRLFDLINDLNEAIVEGKGRDVMASVFDALIDYTAKHFADEEKILEETAYPDLPAQRASHQAFVAKVLEAREAFRTGTGMVASDVINFLNDWLVKHIGGMDKKYGPHVRKAGRGGH